MIPVFNFLRIGHGLSDEKTWGKDWNDSFNRLHIPLSGKAVIRVDKRQEQILEPGKMYLIPSHVNVVLNTVEGEAYEHFYLDFYISPIVVNKELVIMDPEKDVMLRKYKDMFYSTFIEEYSKAEKIQGYVLQHIHRGIQQIGRFEFNALSIPRYFDYFIRSMLLYIFDEYNVKFLKNTRLAKAMEYIYDHYSDDITNEDIAESIHVHPRHLTRLFKEVFNKTPHQCLVEYRINMAINMLEEGQQIKDVCYKCGFKDMVTFRLAFKRMNCYLPSEYKPINKKYERSDKK